MATKIQVKRGTTAQCDALTPDSGEPLWDTTLKQLRIGDGSTAGGIKLTAESAAVLKTLFDAYTILMATTDNTPVALTVTEQTLVGRKTGGAIAALGGADVLLAMGIAASIAELNYVQGVTSAIQTQLDAKVLKATFDANTILKADADDTPAALTVDEQRIVGRITGGVIAALTAAQVITMLGGTARTMMYNGFQYLDTATDWHPHAGWAHLHQNMSAKVVWLPITGLKVGDIITAYRLVGDATEAAALTLDCKLVRINKGDPITTTDITNGAITQITADGVFDAEANPDDETVAADKQYFLEITGTTGAGDEIDVIGAEVDITRLV